LPRRSDTGATAEWTDGKPWEIAWGELRWEERDGRDDRVDGGEAVGNSLGRAPLGRSEMEATTGWTEGKPWEIAWGELRCEGRSRGDSSVVKERDGSDDRVDGGGTAGNNLGELRWERHGK